ncbi:hypothetical protein QVD17_05681 [Tagetes erecta]|uniref:Uncharacterized protein n=1 Tax=Tagetes erecta TaxID=13708 RepID=A0AAD8LCG9_TARER|nr:hypothetical protein QVD17_05681 [Tagetes erecta]
MSFTNEGKEKAEGFNCNYSITVKSARNARQSSQPCEDDSTVHRRKIYDSSYPVSPIVFPANLLTGGN